MCTNQGNDHLCPRSPSAFSADWSQSVTQCVHLQSYFASQSHRKLEDILPLFTYLTHLIVFVSGAGYVYHRAYVPTYRGSLHSEIKPEQNTNKTSLNYVAISWCLALWELAFLLPCGSRGRVGCSGEIRLSDRLGIECLYLLSLPTGPRQS